MVDVSDAEGNCRSEHPNERFAGEPGDQLGLDSPPRDLFCEASDDGQSNPPASLGHGPRRREVGVMRPAIKRSSRMHQIDWCDDPIRQQTKKPTLQ